MRRLLVLSLVLLAAGCGSRSTDHWLTQLKDPDVVKRRQAVRELGEQSSEAEKIVPALVEALRDQSAYVRHDSATALGKFGPQARSAVPALSAALSDKDANVRRMAEAALKKIRPQATANTNRG
jgi:HEAT repeat protein